MGGKDVYITYDELSEVDSWLKKIVQEFKDAEDRQDDLKDAIGKPFGKGDLQDLAHEFEGSWDDRRNKLCSDLEKVQQHVDGVIKGFQKWDKESTQKKDGDG